MIAKLWSYNFRFSTIFSQLLLRNKILIIGYQLNSQLSLDENYCPGGHLQACCLKESFQFEFKFHLLSVKEVRITYFLLAFAMVCDHLAVYFEKPEGLQQAKYHRFYI
jgi:hypothetical protein